MNNRQKLVYESILNAANRVNSLNEAASLNYSDYASSVEKPAEWANWSNSNQIKALIYWTIWNRSGENLSTLNDYYCPDLTKCESWPNAIGYAVHLSLDKFKFEGRTYSTKKLRNSSSSYSNGSTSNSSSSSSDRYNQYDGQSIRQRMRNAIDNDDKEELQSAYQDATELDLTNKERRKLNQANKKANKAIDKDVQGKDNTTQINKFDRKMDKTGIDEAKNIIYSVLKEEIIKRDLMGK